MVQSGKMCSRPRSCHVSPLGSLLPPLQWAWDSAFWWPLRDQEGGPECDLSALVV